MFRGLDIRSGEHERIPINVADRGCFDVTVSVRPDIDPTEHEQFGHIRTRLDRLTEAGIVDTVRIVTQPKPSEQPESDGGIRLTVQEEGTVVGRYPDETDRERRSLTDGLLALYTGAEVRNVEEPDSETTTREDRATAIPSKQFTDSRVISTNI
jgi:hypothetical protein